jgi:hypothetical protein
MTTLSLKDLGTGTSQSDSVRTTCHQLRDHQVYQGKTFTLQILAMCCALEAWTEHSVSNSCAINIMICSSVALGHWLK